MKHPPRLNRRAFIASAVGTTLAASLQAENSSRGRFKLAASQARAITLWDGQIIVAADRALLFHRLSGELVRTAAMPRPVRAVGVDPRGGLVVTFSDQVARVAANGAVELLGAPFGKASALTGIAVAADGRLFAADSAQRLIWRFDAMGTVLGQIRPGTQGFTVSRAFFPIAWQDGHLIVAEPGRHQVQRYSAAGDLISQWGGRSRDAGGFTGCCNPVALATTADGTIITIERGLVRVKQFNSAGQLIVQLAGPEQFTAASAITADDAGDLPGCAGGLFDVATAPDGRVVVLDRTACEVLVLA